MSDRTVGERVRTLPWIVRIVLVSAVIAAPLSLLLAVTTQSAARVVWLFVAQFVMWFVVLVGTEVYWRWRKR